MHIQLDVEPKTLTVEQKAKLDLVETFLSWLPDESDAAARRLALGLLEAGDLARQGTIAEAIGYRSERTIRHLRDELQKQGLSALFDHPRSGRPNATDRSEVQAALVSEVVAQVIEHHQLPDDEALSQAVNARLKGSGVAACIDPRCVCAVGLSR